MAAGRSTCVLAAFSGLRNRGHIRSNLRECPTRRTKPGAMAGLLCKASRSIGASRIVFPQQFISNGWVWIAADHTVARDDIARLYGNARTELIVWIRLGIIGCGSCLMGLLAFP